MKKLLVLFSVLLCVGLASAAQNLPPEEQTLTIFLDEYSKGIGHWMNEQAMGQFPIRITIIYRGKAVLYGPVHVHQEVPPTYDVVRRLPPNFKLVPVPKPKVDMKFDPEVIEKYRKKK
jgi:hypothetical protein